MGRLTKMSYVLLTVFAVIAAAFFARPVMESLAFRTKPIKAGASYIKTNLYKQIPHQEEAAKIPDAALTAIAEKAYKYAVNLHESQGHSLLNSYHQTLDEATMKIISVMSGNKDEMDWDTLDLLKEHGYQVPENVTRVD